MHAWKRKYARKHAQDTHARTHARTHACLHTYACGVAIDTHALVHSRVDRSVTHRRRGMTPHSAAAVRPRSHEECQAARDRLFTDCRASRLCDQHDVDSIRGTHVVECLRLLRLGLSRGRLGSHSRRIRASHLCEGKIRRRAGVERWPGMTDFWDARFSPTHIH